MSRYLSIEIIALSLVIVGSGSSTRLAAENANGDGSLAEVDWLRARVMELERLEQTPVDPDQGLTQQDEMTKAALLDLLAKTGLDAREHPEINRALGEGNELPLHEQILRRREILASVPTDMPIKQGAGYVSSEFGDRDSSFSSQRQFHKGIDLAGAEGTPIYAPADGIVRYASKYGRFGNYISIVHGYGLVTKYAHSSQILVAAGQVVRKGEQIATMGRTGRVTGTHLHYEVWLNDHAVDPARFMFNRPSSLVAQTRNSSDTEATP